MLSVSSYGNYEQCQKKYLHAAPLIDGVWGAPPRTGTTANALPSSLDGSVEESSMTPELINPYGRPSRPKTVATYNYQSLISVQLLNG